MMSVNDSARARGDVAKLGDAIFKQRIEPTLKPEDKGKFVAIAVDSGEYEISENDQIAMSRLFARQPNEQMFLMRVGYAAAYRIGPRR